MAEPLEGDNEPSWQPATPLPSPPHPRASILQLQETNPVKDTNELEKSSRAQGGCSLGRPEDPPFSETEQ